MLLSHSKNFVFIHLHKCGGTSVKDALMKDMAPGDLLVRSFLETEDGFKLSKHSTAQEVFDFLGPSRWNELTKMALVRNPYSLVASLFSFSRKLVDHEIKRGRLHVQDIERFRQGKPFPNEEPLNYGTVRALLMAGYPVSSFEAFVGNEWLWKDLSVQSSQTKKLTVRDSDGERLGVDLLGKLEEIGDFWERVSALLGCDVSLPRLNISQNWADNTWKRLYSKSSMDRVYSAFEEDFRVLGYSPVL